MTRIILTIPLVLAACATPFRDCPREYVICDPATKRCICDAPTATLPAALREKGDKMPDAVKPEPPTVELPRPEPKPKPEPPVEPPKPEPDGPKHPGEEPNSKIDPEGHRAWQERRDAYVAGGGKMK